ncbi:MAG: isoamylase early set domain-containing protein [bacterium]
MIEREDEMIQRIVDELRPMPHVNAEAKARLLVAVAAERERDREAARNAVIPGTARRWMVRGSALAAAAVVAALLLRQPSQPSSTAAIARASQTATTAAASMAPAPAPAVAQLAGTAADAADVALQPVQLVFRAPTASHVRVVGDFNAWDAQQAPMVHDTESGLWSVNLMLRPGRHVYAFVVDDTLWVRDPRAPAARDADFGRPGSVLLVGRP